MRLFVKKYTETFHALHSRIPTSILLSQEDMSESQWSLQYLFHFLGILEFLPEAKQFLVFVFYFYRTGEE